MEWDGIGMMPGRGLGKVKVEAMDVETQMRGAVEGGS